MNVARRVVLALLAAIVVGACSTTAGDESAVRTRPSSASTTTVTPETTTSLVEEATGAPGDGPPEALPADGEEDPLVGLPARPRTNGPVRAARAAPTGGVNRIEIPKIGLSHATFEGIDLPTINRGPSHWPDTPFPGERGNTVFPGHRTTYTRPFWDIDKLAPGDEVIFTTAAGRFTYRVTRTFVVGSHDTWIIDPTEHASFTIFACHPKGSARQRYVVKGDLVSPPAPTPTPAPAASSPPPPPPPAESTTTTTAPSAFPGVIPGLGG